MSFTVQRRQFGLRRLLPPLLIPPQPVDGADGERHQEDNGDEKVHPTDAPRPQAIAPADQCAVGPVENVAKLLRKQLWGEDRRRFRSRGHNGGTQSGNEVLHAGVTVARLLGQRLHDGRFDRLGNVGGRFAQQRWRFVNLLVNGAQSSVGLKRGVASQQGVGNEAQRIDIAANARSLPLRLFG